MRVRTKLFAAVAVALVLLLVQIGLVSIFIRELQTAVTFIGSAHTVIEADFEALEAVNALRSEVKRLPSRTVAAQDDANPLRAHWERLTALIPTIMQIGCDAGDRAGGARGGRGGLRQGERRVSSRRRPWPPARSISTR